jgi:DNA-binding transcriptional LysR family regulator
MELTPLRYFIAIAAAGHMTRAARSLGVTQPALSAMLRKLEAEVGAELLQRTGRGVQVTEAGRAFLTHAQDAVRRADAAVRAVREVMGLERGSIRVGGGATAVTYLLPPVVSAVRRRHPGLRFYVREAGSRAVAAAVLADELDLGIVTLPIPQAGELVETPLVEDELRLIVPPGHALAGRRQFRWKDLEGQPVVGFEAGAAVRAVLDRAAAAEGVTLNIVMELRSIESIRQMVAAGVGVGFVSRFALPEGQGLACRDGRLARRLAILRLRDRGLNPAPAAFERALLDSVGAGPGGGLGRGRGGLR